MHRAWTEHCHRVHETARSTDHHVTGDDIALLLVYLSEGIMSAVEELTAEVSVVKSAIGKVLELQAQQDVQITALEAAVANSHGDDPQVVAAVNDLKASQSQIQQVLDAHAPAPDNQGTVPTSPGLPQTVPADTTDVPAPNPDGSETVPVGGGDPVPTGTVPDAPETPSEGAPAPSDPVPAPELPTDPSGAPVPDQGVPPESTPAPGTLDPDPTTVTTAPAPDDSASPFAV